MTHSRKDRSEYDNKYYYKIRSRKESYILKKTGGKCELCKSHWPSDVLCFHHLDPKEKKFSLGIPSWASNRLDDTLKEAEKCAVLCMNCHALEHKALNRGETLINDYGAYIRYRNHRFSGNGSVDGGDKGLTNVNT